MNLVKEIAEKDNQLVKQLSKEINREASLSVKQNENIDIKVVKYYQQNIDLYKELIQKNDTKQKRFKKYLKRKKQEKEINGANIRIIELAKSSCSVFGYFR